MNPTRFYMPAVFGPSNIPDESHIPHAEVVSIVFETTRDAAAKLLPRHFELGDLPLITVSRIEYQEVDYLGGRSYSEVVVSVRAVYRGMGEPIAAGFAPVMWVSEVGALISGRELMGFAKLPGEMEAIQREGDSRRFGCSEYGALLLQGEVRGMRPLVDETLARVQRNASEVNTFGWKYIPNNEAVPDVDYPTLNVMRWNYDKAWTGEGRLQIFKPDQRTAPLSARVMAALDALPIKQYRPAFVGEGSAVIDRMATRRLDVQSRDNK
ncbi:acetoacetate decarboxylase family protein [Noviherbaspirillum sedimenti]|uniref:Acetoacetate decarboxylase n=1 Tax=Noviherbaspirillum sedimenti TaxID=2320865 RepID=A0A3A3FYT7_9BURK|nr:acetoacetate decarboxylase family protein [Noviherbaspirillum sedimenti]RJG01368.1 acetoacetate decarboxylase [Noviherbaspirillum sedimenti]